jgi:Bacterial Ig domain/Putative Ig domain/Immunoglobulin domain/Immunoglobulin I-set domain
MYSVSLSHEPALGNILKVRNGNTNRLKEALLLLPIALMSAGCAGVTQQASTTTPVGTAPVAPAITAQPANQSVTVGQPAAFTVTATGTAPLTYQWQKNGTAITGATSSGYTTAATTSSDDGSQFRVVVTNSAGSMTSGVATLTVSAAAVAPSITTQPASQSVTAGQTATFTVTATGTAPLIYQWQKNGTAIAGATSSTYTTPATISTDNGAQFTATVKNSVGSTTSSAATLTVSAVSSPPQITSSQLPGGFVAGSYSATLAATGGTTPYTWSIASGTLPSGLSLASNGAISGKPTSAGSFSFSAQVKDAAAHSASANLSINITTSSPSVAITSPSSGSTLSGMATVSGTASDGVAISSVQLSVDSGSFASAAGTSNWSFALNTSSLSNGSHTLTAKATDAAGVSSTSSPVAITVSNGSLASDCTLFASPSGNDSNSGSSPSSPKSFQGAANATQPGSVLCLLGGTYNFSSSFTPPHSGSPSSWIVYKNYGDGPVYIHWTGPADASPIFRLGTGGFPSGGPSYLEFRGLNLDGLGNAGDAFFCSGTHHLRFISNSMSNTGGSGVGSRDCDYLTADHNIINHNGYMPASTSVPQWYGWTSGISYNSNQWFDNYPGFHNIISNNIVVGEYDSSTNHTDGNGIILDLSNGSYTPSTANTPPVLIVNNVVYGNGGRCIHAFIVTNFWVVNNTCYKNNLDPTLGTAGSFSTNGSQNGYFINNISVAWSGSDPTYVQESSNSNIQYFADMYYGSSPNFSSSQLIQADPLFVNPPVFLPGVLGQYATALAASLLGNGLTLLPVSPAYGKGIDPSTLSGLPPAIISDLKTYIYTDINGKTRPQGGGSDLGAYQH